MMNTPSGSPGRTIQSFTFRQVDISLIATVPNESNDFCSFSVVEHRYDEHAWTTFNKSTLKQAILEFDRRVAMAAAREGEVASHERTADRRFALSQ